MATEEVNPSVVYHFLDMGEEKYGECILVTAGSTKVLIDGGHPSDYKDRTAQSVPNQLSTLIEGPPFTVDLLVVTHCHSDHIGCLPMLVAQGTLHAKRVLAANPDLGFAGANNAPTDDVAAALRNARTSSLRLVAALQEEDHSDLSDAALAEFIDVASRQEDSYRKMLNTLKNQGANVTLFNGVDDTVEISLIERAVAVTGMKVLGPTMEQLKICNAQICKFAKDAAELSDQLMDAAFGSDEVSRYRHLVGQRSLRDGVGALVDMFGAGSAINCQSIVLAFGPETARVLLGADMQFTEPQVSGLDAAMASLRDEVAGEYRLVKMTHHTSYNGTKPEFLARLGRPTLLVHSGGSNDASHPDSQTLEALKELNDQTPLHFVRTDRNGLIVADPSKPPSRVFKCSTKGEDDFSANSRDVTATPPAGPSAATLLSPPPPRSTASTGNQQYVDITILRVPLVDGRVSVDGHTIEVGAAPAAAAALSLHPERPQAAALQGASGIGDRSSGGGPVTAARAPKSLAAGRSLPKLLFVTDSRKLAHNIGASETSGVLDLIRKAKQPLLDVANTSRSAADAVSSCLRAGRGYKGVVILGGYDVIPSQRIDVLDAPLRQQVVAAGHGNDDPDNFVVWNDDIYGDARGDGSADLPVSRVPDARTAALVFSALSGGRSNPPGRFGIRNSARPFATPIFAMLPGNQQLWQCGPTVYSAYTAAEPATTLHYFMLHGSAQDGSRYWGESQSGLEVALTTEQVKRGGVDTAFAGCCWGALTVQQQANDSTPVAAKTPLSSIALTTLLGGARAFVGCTGAHYSPDASGGFFGGPMHRAFWTHFQNGKAPAEALFSAKKDFLAGMPHGLTQPFEVGVEKKVYKMFTCLGLGW